MSQSMRHPDLGDVVEVPDFAVPGYEQRGYEHVDTSVDEQPVVEQADTTSETAPVPGSDDGGDAVTPAD